VASRSAISILVGSEPCQWERRGRSDLINHIHGKREWAIGWITQRDSNDYLISGIGSHSNCETYDQWSIITKPFSSGLTNCDTSN